MRIVTGNLLKQETEAIVNPWNRNLIPWWLLSPHGVSGDIKRMAGLEPFRELSKFGVMALGSAVHTSAGKLSFKAIIHVATISMMGRSSISSIQRATTNAVQLGGQLKLTSIAFPIFGSGSGGVEKGKAEQAMKDIFDQITSNINIVLVRYEGF